MSRNIIIVDYGRTVKECQTDLSFSDEEVISIYLFGVIDGKTKRYLRIRTYALTIR